MNIVVKRCLAKANCNHRCKVMEINAMKNIASSTEQQSASVQCEEDDMEE